MEKIYIISHDNEDVRVGLISFRNQQEAVDKARRLARTFCTDIKYYKEIADEEFVFFAKYSAEGHGVAVAEVDIEFNPKVIKKLKIIPYMDEIMTIEFFARVYYLWGTQENVEEILMVEKAITSSRIKRRPYSGFKCDDTTYFIDFRYKNLNSQGWYVLTVSQEVIARHKCLRMGGLSSIEG